MDTIPSIRKEGRSRSYVTIVDTGLLLAAQHMLAGLCLAKLGEDGMTFDDVDTERLLELANRLAGELETRTF